MSLSVATPAAPNGDNSNTQGHCSRCHRVWTLKERQGVCRWCGNSASCQSTTAKPRHIKSRSNGRLKQANGNGNGYDQLDGDWLSYYKVASKFSHKAKAEDTETEAEKAQAVAEAEAVVKADKPKRHRKREPVAVA